MSVQLRNIERFFKASFAGVRSQIKIIVPDDVTSFTDAQAEGGITVSAGKTIYQIDADPRSVRVREARRGGVHGASFERSLSLTMRKLDQAKQELRQLLTNRRVHLLFTDDNCQTYVYLNMRLRRDDAENGGGTNEVRFGFEGEGRKPAPFVQGVLLPAPTGPTQGSGGDIGGPTYEPADDGGGVSGGTTDEDIGGGGGDGTDDGDGDDGDGTTSSPANRAVARQPSTGDLFEIIVGSCDELITIPYVE